MRTLGLLTEIGTTKSFARLQQINEQAMKTWIENGYSDQEAEIVFQAVHDRKRVVRDIDTVAHRMPSVASAAIAAGRTSHFPPKRKVPCSRDREASIARRRLNAASGPMPPSLAAKFTTGELSVLNIVADEVRSKGACAITLGEIAARAGVCITTARNAIRYAAAYGFVIVEERRRHQKPNLANVIKITSAEWLSWLEYRRRKNTDFRGCKKVESTDSIYKINANGERLIAAHSVRRLHNHPQRPPKT